MKLCPNCGKSLAESIEFCPDCGAPAANAIVISSPAEAPADISQPVPAADTSESVPPAAPVESIFPADSDTVIPDSPSFEKKKKSVNASTVIAAILGIALVGGSIGGVLVAKDKIETSYKAGYTEAYNIAFDEGRSEGVTEGQAAGYESGYSEGETAGYESGYSEGENAGYENGYTEGENAGYENGYSEGETAGYDKGYTEGETAGYDKGYTEGETAGYNKGYTEGETAGYESGYAEAKEQYEVTGAANTGDTVQYDTAMYFIAYAYKYGWSEGYDACKYGNTDDSLEWAVENLAEYDYTSIVSDGEYIINTILRAMNPAASKLSKTAIDYDTVMYYISCAYEYGWSKGYDVADTGNTDTSLEWAINALADYDYDYLVEAGEAIIGMILDAMG